MAVPSVRVVRAEAADQDSRSFGRGCGKGTAAAARAGVARAAVARASARAAAVRAVAATAVARAVPVRDK